MYKNRLQEFAQKSHLPLPEYSNVNEGFPHAPKFRSMVTLDGRTFTSSQTFTHRIEAEQDVAKIAYESVTRMSRDQDQISVQQARVQQAAHENPRLSFGLKLIFCKSILHEYAIKVNLGLPKYDTRYAEDPSRPVFISRFELGGKIYTGEEAKSLKEAEQLVARSAIQSLLKSDTNGDLARIIKSKERLYSPHETLPPQHPQPANFRRPEPSNQARNQPTQMGNVGNDFDPGRVIDPRRAEKRKIECSNINMEKRSKWRN